MKRYVPTVLMIGFFIWMLCFPHETFYGASSGLLLWFQIVLPTLLPFMILSNLLIYTNAVSYVSNLIKPFIQRLFCVSDQGSYAIFIGFLCGYPMGAKVIGDLILTKRISLQEGQYLLSFCNNTSPMFIISFVVIQNFKNESLLLGTLFILFLSPVICSFLFRRFYSFPKKCSYKNITNEMVSLNFNIFDHCIMNSFTTITKVGGYIILFSVLFALCSRIPFLQILLPVLEITNGISWVTKFQIPLYILYPYVLGIISFGGFCSVAQTKAMIQETGLAISPYIVQKLITALVTSLFAILYIYFIHR